MVKITVQDQGDNHCLLTHGPSGSHIETDAPLDNHGRGEKFSPTDLMGAALGSCILTTMSILAAREKISLLEARCEVDKEMNASPRRIGKLIVNVWMPANLSSDQKKKLEAAAHTCPVHRSLHPDIEAPIIFHYPEASS